MFERLIGDRHDREHGIESAIRDMNAAIDCVNIVDVVNSAVFVHDGNLGIISQCGRCPASTAAKLAVNEIDKWDE